jgi:DNA polymerase I-like protein with 3'-5' exonuclease and polymerase domains
MKLKDYHVGGEQLLLITPDSDWRRVQRLPDLRNCTDIALDTENCDEGLMQGKGPGWAINAGYICGISVAWRDAIYHSHYIPLCHPDTDCFHPDQVKRWLKDHMRAGINFYFHNAPYDVGWLAANLKLEPTYKINDTGCMAYMCDENRMSYSLNAIAKWRGIPGKNENKLREAALAYGVDPKAGLHKLPARYVGEYAEQDAMATLMLAEDLHELMIKEEVINAYQLEMNLVPLVHEMRRRGVRIDEKAINRAYKKFKYESKEALKDLSDKLGMTVGMDEIRSTSWLEKVFDHHKINYPLTKKTARGSFEAKWMKEVDHWLPRLLVRAKQRDEAAEKFIKGYLQGFSHKGRLHASVHQFKSEDYYGEEGRAGGTRTYRFSYSDPPLQQIPHRDGELATEIRGCFIAEEGEIWARADYSQQEFRLIVHFAESLNLTKAKEAAQRYRDDPDTDFHQMVADMTGLPRKPAKDANFARAYGAGVKKFAIMIKKTETEAAKIMEQYNERMPFVNQLFDYCQAVAEQRGFIKLLDGAKIRFDFWVGVWRDHKLQWTKENAMSDCLREEALRRQSDPTHPWYQKSLRRSRCNKALNSLIQGGAARQTKIAMSHLWKEKLVPLLQVHDELCFSIKDKTEAEKIRIVMQDAVKLRIPMKVDVGLGDSWAG